MQVISGTYTGENRDTLAGYLKTEGYLQTSAKFTLNPKANPTYNVIGFGFPADKSQNSATDNLSETTKQAIVSLSVQQGLNKAYIEKSSTKTYLAGPIEITGNGINDFIDAKSSVLDKLYEWAEDLSDAYYRNSKSSSPIADSAVLASYDTAEKQAWRTSNGITYLKEFAATGVNGSGESYSYTYKIPEEGLEAGKAYVFLVTGWDKDGLTYSNNGYYQCIKYVVNGNLPKFKGVQFKTNETNPVTLTAGSYTNKASLSIFGQGTSDSSTIAKVEWALSVTDEVTSTTKISENELKGAQTFDSGLGTQDFDINMYAAASDAQKAILDAADSRYLYTVNLTVYDAGGNNFQTQYQIHVDTKAPAIEFTQAKTVYTTGSGTSQVSWVGQNGLSQLRGTIDEENPQSGTYKILVNDVEKKSGDFGRIYSFDFTDAAATESSAAGELNGITLSTNDTLKVIVTATDKAGNTGSKTSDTYTGDGEAPSLVPADDSSLNVKEIRIGGKKYSTDPITWMKDTALTFEGYYKEDKSGLAAIHYLINPPAGASVSESYVKANATGAMGAERTRDANDALTGYWHFNSTISGFSSSGESTIYLVGEDNVGNLSSLQSYTLYIDQTPPQFTEVTEENRNKPTNGSANVDLNFTVNDQEGASGINWTNIAVTGYMNGTEYPISGMGVKDGQAAASADGVSNVCSLTDHDNSTGSATFTITKEFIKAKHKSKDGLKTNMELNGNVTIQITVYDNAGNSSTNQQFILQVDSQAPTLKVTSPKAVTASAVSDISWITGKTTLMGTVTDVGVAGVDYSDANFKFLIPNKTQQAAIEGKDTASDRLASLNGAVWSSFTETDGVTWSIDYQSSYLEAATGKAGTPAEGKASFVYYGAAKDASGNLIYASEYGSTESEKARYRTVPLYFLVTDLAGNQDIITGNKFYVDILGGKPTAAITYPKEWAKVSEEIALQGNAKDNEGISKVYMSGLWYSTEDIDTISANYNSTSSNIWKQVQSGQVELTPVDGISLEKSSSGNLTIEQTVTGSDQVVAFDIEFKFTSDFLNGIKAEGKKIHAVKATVCAQDENEYSYASDRYNWIDTEAPKLVTKKLVKLSDELISPVRLSSFDSNTLTTINNTNYSVEVERPYTADMYISGANSAHWYFLGEVTDDSTVEGVTLSSDSNFKLTEEFKPKTAGGEADTTNDFIFLIPIPASSDGYIYSALGLDDGAHKDVNEYIALHIDNTAPAMYSTVKADGTSSSTGALITNSGVQSGKLRLLGTGVLGEKYVIENSNGSFSLTGQVDENGSNSSALYFVSFFIEKYYNDDNKTGTYYSPLFGDISSYDNAVQITGAIPANPVSGTVYRNSEGLPSLFVGKGDITVGSSEVNNKTVTTITYSGLSANKHINHSYGLVKIAGSYYRSTAISGNTLTLETDLGLSSGSGVVDVEFLYSQVVDHLGMEAFEQADDGSSYSVTNDEDGDNGDRLAESLSFKNGTYTWNAVFDSNHIKDGPVRIHVLAMDNAGNSSYGYVDTSVQNNRPRIAKVFLATDLNGNGTFDFYSESATGFGQALSTRSYKNPYAYDVNSIAVEDGTELGEFMFFSTLDDNGNSQALATIKDMGVNKNFVVMDKFLIMPEIVGGNGGASAFKYTYDVQDNASSVEVKKDTEHIYDILTGDNLTSKLAKKSGSTGDTSLLPSTGIYFGSNGTLSTHESWTQINGQEEKKSKFFGITIWDATDTSSGLQQGKDTLWALLSIPVVVNVTDDIAPKATITPFYWVSKENSSTVYDDEEQPEGHIDFKDSSGTVMAKPGVAGKIYLDGSVTDDSRVDEIYITDPSGTQTLAAKRDEGWKVTAAALNVVWPANWEEFKIVSEVEPTQRGNTVKWRLTINTSTYGVAADKVFKVTAKDKSNNSSTPGENQTSSSENTGYYKMDFVPYIKNISLEDDSILRSRLGRYSVQAGKAIKIEGMNFGTSGSATVHFYKSDANGAQGEEDTSMSKTVSVTDNIVTVAAPAYSRFVAVEVGGQTTQNNTNNNASGHNIEEGYKDDSSLGLNSANRSGANWWTDDRYIAVWNVDTKFTGSINPHSGVIKKVTSSNSDDGKVYTKETGSAGVDPVSGMDDTYFGALSSDDLRVYTYDLDSKNENDIGYRYTFGTNNTDIFRVPADQLDCTIINGVPYYVVQDNWVGNVDANCWGPGLFFARAGWQWNKSDLNSDGNPANESNYHIIIEKQGNSGSARARSSSSGYDYVLYQFKNPRIAGWHKEAQELTYDNNGQSYAPSTDYIYISYYDSYARCLKYAAYRAGHRINGNGKLDYVGGMWGSSTGKSNGQGGDLKIEMRMADNMTAGKAVVAGYDTLNNNPTSFKEEAGEWNDIMIEPTSKMPIIIYYNKSKRSLEVAVGKQSFPTHDGNVIAAGEGYKSGTDNTESTTGWTKTKGITPNTRVDFGRYVSAAIDASGNIHVAAQDATNAKLYYLYLTKSSGYTISKSAVVDSTSGAGRWTDIELTKASGSTLAEIKPVISYINTSYLGTTQGVRTAYLEKLDSDGKPVFEAITDPSNWQAGDQRTSVLPDVKESKTATGKAVVGVGFNSDMLALDFLRGE